MRAGYLVPEFPGQTHTFFWREIAELQKLGLQLELVSTRRPNTGVVSQNWASVAAAQTAYLAPLSLRTAGAALAVIAAADRGSWGSIVGSIIREVKHKSRSEGLPGAAKGLLRMAGLVIAGAELAGLARSQGWAHVHIHSCADSAQLGLFAHRLAGLSYSLTLHGPLGDYGSNQVEKFEHASFATVITNRLRREVESELGATVRTLLEIAPMGVDTHQFTRSDTFTPWSGTGPALIFSCGRLNPSKGHDDLIRAVASLVNQGMDVNLTIAGEDDVGGTGYRSTLEQLIVATKMQERVQLLGAVSEDVVRKFLGTADVFALASHAEPLGVAIMEAMAMEVPVVVGGGGGVSELVEDGVTGLLVPPGDPAALAATLRRLLTQPALALELGRKGRLEVARAFDCRRGAEVLNRLIRESARSGGKHVRQDRP